MIDAGYIDANNAIIQGLTNKGKQAWKEYKSNQFKSVRMKAFILNKMNKGF
ncbi:hypothetical protein WR164_14640 [Philodulcilactobacillus myokoensis]|uniref:Uncharacterized protein n=1 Tax=Philodulcilactobacillus myokoensis TaxID=2929573 RepID=A0A9W6B235_9LACO|nr:hypothetical protein [Philodulcilactobacillus myokoensis]GLB47485.1 hypothetical protein WR164_14640 [Philodulcilactobacillus myokoensis]